MKRISNFILLTAALALAGAGCISFGSSATTADGGLWQTVDNGKHWAQLAALPQASGVGTIGGVNVNALEIDPGDPTAYYLGTKTNGMLFSYDSGSTWQRPEDEMARTGNVLDIEVDPRDVCTIYLLKSDRVMKSTDCARNFSSVYVETREEKYLTQFVIDWYTPDILWVGTTDSQLIRTTDAGASWNLVQEFRGSITALTVSNVDSRIVFVGTKTYGMYRRDPDSGEFVETKRDFSDYVRADRVYGFAQTANGSKLLMSTAYGLFQSEDKGLTWAAITLPTPPGDVHVYSIAIDPKNQDVMYYGTDAAFYTSSNSGESWETVELPSTRALTVLEVNPVNTTAVLGGFSQVE